MRTTNGKDARKPLKVWTFQDDFICGVFDPPRPRAALWSMPRGQGNLPRPPALALRLFADGEGARVIHAAAERDDRGVLHQRVRQKA